MSARRLAQRVECAFLSVESNRKSGFVLCVYFIVFSGNSLRVALSRSAASWK